MPSKCRDGDVVLTVEIHAYKFRAGVADFPDSLPTRDDAGKYILPTRCGEPQIVSRWGEYPHRVHVEHVITKKARPVSHAANPER